MKPTWSAEAASKAYIHAVRALHTSALHRSSDVAEFVSALAAGSNAQLMVEAWAPGAGTANSIGLAVARAQTGGRHVCVVPDEQSRLEYADAASGAGVSPEVAVGEADETMEGLRGVDFMVVDGRRRDWIGLLRLARISSWGAFLVRMHAGGEPARSDIAWPGLVGSGTRVLRSTFLPVGEGVEIAKLGSTGGSVSDGSRWINLVDRRTGEEYFIRR